MSLLARNIAYAAGSMSLNHGVSTIEGNRAMAASVLVNLGCYLLAGIQGVKMSKIRRYRGADSGRQESTAECRQAHVAPPIHRPGRLPVHDHRLRCLRPPLIRKFLLTLFSLDTRTESYWYFVQLQKYDFRHLYHVFSLTPFSLHVIVFFDTMFHFVRLCTILLAVSFCTDNVSFKCV